VQTAANEIVARQERDCRLGEPTSVRRFIDARHFALAGDFVAWAEDSDDSIMWQRLPMFGGDGTASDTRVVSVPGASASQPLAIRSLELNPDGILLARFRVEPSVYVFPNSGPCHSFWYDAPL
jgi:hypothetical protein